MLEQGERPIGRNRFAGSHDLPDSDADFVGKPELAVLRVPWRWGDLAVEMSHGFNSC